LIKTSDGCDYPDDRLYYVDHDIWLKPAADQAYRVGVAKPFLFYSGRLSRITCRSVGSFIRQNTSLALLVSSRMEGALLTPFDCKVTAVNAAALSNPDIVSEDPYGDGWIVEVAAEGPTPRLLEAAEASKAYVLKNRERGVVCLDIVPHYEIKVFGETCESILSQVGDYMRMHIKQGETLHVITSDPATEVDMISWAEKTGQGLLEIRRVGKTLHVLYRRLV
jgi:glycine cleavage system H protein